MIEELGDGIQEENSTIALWTPNSFFFKKLQINITLQG